MKKYIISSGIILLAFVSLAGAQEYTFSNNLSVGVSGPDVSALQSWLISNGFDIPAISSGMAGRGYFGAQTRMALMRYQGANGIPNTGYFGPMTRGRLNERHINDNRAPIINGIDAPTSLNVNQTGTWNVRATDPQNGTLSYSVDWGDVVAYAAVACPAGYSCTPINLPTVPIQQGSTFTHAYSNAGTYTVRFTVRNSLGLSVQSSATVQVGNNSSAGNLKLVSPNGGEVWQKGTTQTIRWTSPYYFRATYADLKLIPYYQPCTGQVCPMGAQSSMMYPYNAPYAIATNISINQNSYSWNVGKYIGVTPLPYCASFGPNGECLGQSLAIPDGQYTIQICETGTNNCDSSDQPFTITSSASQTVKVMSPNGGEIWTANSTHQISWYLKELSDSNTKVDIYLNRNVICQAGTTCLPGPYVLDKNIPYNSTYNWIVATDINNNPIPAGQFKVNICLTNTSNCDSSDNWFTISSTLLRVCPSQKIVNQMPTTQPNQNPTSSYYVLNGQRRELTEFDQNWVQVNCTVPQQIVY